MKIAAAIATILVATFSAASTASVTTPTTASRAAAVSRDVVVVSTTADVVNGDVSSIAALNAKPGRGGISLREALEAANHTRGTATVYIMFSHRLNGKTIEVRKELPSIHRDHLVLEGIAPNGSPARVTLDGQQASATLAELLQVQASEVTVRWLRFTGVDPSRNLATQVSALVVHPGLNSLDQPPSPGPLNIANVQIVDDIFDNSAINWPNTPPTGGGNSGELANALMVEGGGPGGANTHISGITIARNTFIHFDNDACGVLEAASGDTSSDVVILDNTFEANSGPIELGVAYAAPRAVGTQIIGNTITGSDTTKFIGGGGITLDMGEPTTNGTIDQTLIEDNVISGLQTAAILLDAALFGPSGGVLGLTSSGNVISNTQIVNNVIRLTVAGATAIGLIGGNGTSSPPSQISGVTIENDTIVNDQGTANLFSSVPNGTGASGNTITDVTVRNTILWDPNGRPIAQGNQPVVSQAPDVLTNSLISGPGWAGNKGNINANPQFVNEPAGDYHLAAGSPAINAGTTIGAPSDDLDGALRDAQPDIGAFEFGAVARPLLSVTAEQLGSSGTVTSSPAGITCGTACSARFDPSTSVTLTAKPDRGSRFLGWQNGCSGVGRCTVSLTSAQSVTARFAPR